MCLRTKPWPLDSFKIDLNLIDDILEKVTSAVRENCWKVLKCGAQLIKLEYTRYSLRSN